MIPWLVNVALLSPQQMLKNTSRSFCMKPLTLYWHPLKTQICLFSLVFLYLTSWHVFCSTRKETKLDKKRATSFQLHIVKHNSTSFCWQKFVGRRFNGTGYSGVVRSLWSECAASVTTSGLLYSEKYSGAPIGKIVGATSMAGII